VLNKKEKVMKTNLLKPLAIALTIAVNLWAFTNGDGSAAAPFVISTPEHLNAVRNNLTAHYRLANNITLTGEWVPIPEFQGTFDGNGRTISGVAIDNYQENQAFFGVVGNNGVVRNLSLEVDIVASRTAALAAINHGTIENCRASGSIWGVAVGGLVAENRGVIRNSHSSVVTNRFDVLPVTTLPSNPTNGQAVPLRIDGDWGRVFIELVYVAPGTFMFGACASTTPATVGTSRTISNGFWIGKYPITQAQYLAVMGSFLVAQAFPDRPSNPVTDVSWNDVTAVNGFLARIGARLPTSEEWEFAARGGNRRGGNNGGVDFIWAGSNNANEVAWHSGHRPTASTQPVGGLVANELGIYDMSGNVWEWTSTVSGASRVDRGGGWGLNASRARVVSSDIPAPTIRYSDIGFRVALSAI